MLADRRVEQADSLVLGLHEAVQRVDPAQEPLGPGHGRGPEPPATTRAGVERTRGALEAAQLLHEGGALGLGSGKSKTAS